MPGAVLTKNTKYLENTIFNIKVDSFVKNIIKVLVILMQLLLLLVS